MIAIVIPNRTRRWFHDWKPGVDLSDNFPPPTYNVFGTLAGRPFGSWSAVPGVPGEHIDLTGIQEQIGVSNPITSGEYMGISRSEITTGTHIDPDDWKVPPPAMTAELLAYLKWAQRVIGQSAGIPSEVLSAHADLSTAQAALLHERGTCRQSRT